MTTTIENTWGGRLRRYREGLGLSQDQFADQVMLVCARMSREQAECFEQLRLICPKTIAGYEISRYESGKRTPMHRSMHMLFVWVLVQLGVSLELETVNEWLELGQQGWLTNRERITLFE